MTFSIVARSDDGETWGVAVASKFLAVGSAVPAASAGVGALATQAFVNTSYKEKGLALLKEGGTAAETLQRLLDEDEGRDSRQVGIVDRDGVAETYTGPSCMDYAGGVSGDGYAIQGNIIEDENVVLLMEAAFLASDRVAPLAVRLMAALRAGDAAGGDIRGRQSAALLVVKNGVRGFDVDEMDLRVDDHVSPIDELDRLLEVHQLLHSGSKIPEGERTPDTTELFAEMDARAVALGYRSVVVWIFQNNYEMLAGEDWTATRVIEELRAATPDWHA